MSNVWGRLWRKQGDERGVILIMSTVGILLAVVAAALAVDIGTLAQQRRRDQKIADLASLDAVRDFANMQARAEESAQRNGFPLGTTGHSITAIEGRKVNGSCQPATGAGTVCVTVGSPHKNSFLPGGNAVAARAVAGTQSAAGFCMGSSFLSANLDTATSLPLLNRVFGRMLGGPTGQANVLSYKGLADANVRLRDIQAAMGFGTLNELLTTNMTMGQLLTATGTVLNNQGTAAAITAYNDIVRLQNTTTSTAQFKLGDYISVAQGMDNKAADANFNVFDLITGGAQVANKNNLIDAGSIVTLPVNFGSLGTSNLTTKLTLKVIEGPQCYIGPEADATTTPIKTSQMEVTLTPTLAVDFTAPLINLLSLLTVGTAALEIHGEMPVKFTAAGALGLLEDVRCTAPNQGLTVQVTSLPVTTSVSAALRVYSDAAALLTENVRVNLNVSPTEVNSTPGGPYHPVFNYPNDFTPPDPDGQSTPGAPVGVTFATGASGNVSTSIGALGLNLSLLTGITEAGVANAVINPILTPVFNAISDYLTTPALKALGVTIGPVDVTAPAQYFDTASCGQPGLLQ